MVWCSTKCTMWEELELRWKGRKLELQMQARRRMRSCGSRLVGVGQPKGGDSQCRKVVRRVHQKS